MAFRFHLVQRRTERRTHWPIADKPFAYRKDIHEFMFWRRLQMAMCKRISASADTKFQQRRCKIGAAMSANGTIVFGPATLDRTSLITDRWQGSSRDMSSRAK